MSTPARSVFLLYMPPGNTQAMVNFENTIRKRVELSAIERFLDAKQRSRLHYVFGGRRIAVWGSRSGPQNRAKFDRMREGDDILILVGDRIRFIGKAALKVSDASLSRELWPPLNPADQTVWDLIYFIANPRELDVPMRELNALFSYQPDYLPQGFSAVAADKLEAFYDRYDDLYSVLLKLQGGGTVVEKTVEPEASTLPPADSLAELTLDDVRGVVQSEVSEHVRMQWLLAGLGIKAGQKVWVPLGDQKRIREAFAFDQFEPAFAAGIDLPSPYVENIDVVWKDEFRIDAAFEVEHSTAIYSGLLRFADLNVVAPNSTYPMFIAAPAERRSRVRDQLARPTFKRLRMAEKVRFLPYEAISQIDDFFGPDAGLSVEVIAGRSERLL